MNNQLVILNGQSITEQEIYSGIDDVLVELRETNDLSKADAALQSLDRIENVSGIAKAKLLAGMFEWWMEQENDEDGFFDHINIMDANKRTYAERLINVWNYQGKLPQEIKRRTLKEQIPIVSALAQGYEIDDGKWQQLIQSKGESEIRTILREIKTSEPRKSTLTIYLERDGSLNVWRDGQVYSLGYLDVEEAKKNDVVQKAVERIISNSGVIRK